MPRCPSVGFFVDHWPSIKTVVQPIIDQVVSRIRLVVTTVRDMVQLIVAIFKGDWKQAWEEVKDIVGNFKTYFVDTWNQVVAFLSTVIPLMLEAGKLAMQAAWDGIQWVWDNALLPGLKAMPGLMKDAFFEAISLMYEAGKDALDGLKRGADWLWDNQVKPFFTGLPGKIGDALSGIGGAIIDALKAGWTAGSAIDWADDNFKFQMGGLDLGILGTTPSIGFDPDLSFAKLARGGITTGPTLALLGDNPGGREAVIPLPPGGGLGGFGGGGDIHITLEVDGDVLASVVAKAEARTL